jgi:hypothetical protein
MAVLYEFGPQNMLEFVRLNFIVGGQAIAITQKARDVFTNGTYSADQQWKTVLGGALPPVGNCFICGLPCGSGAPGEWAQPQIEHLLPSAMAFLTIGLPGKFTQGIHAKLAESYPGIADFSRVVVAAQQLIQRQDFDWAHRLCNTWKSDLLFMNLLFMSPGCLGGPPPCNFSVSQPITVAASASFPFETFIQRANTSQAPGKTAVGGMAQNRISLGLGAFGDREKGLISAKLAPFAAMLEAINTQFTATITSPTGERVVMSGIETFIACNLLTAVAVFIFATGGRPENIASRLATLLTRQIKAGGKRKLKRGGGVTGFVLPNSLKITPEEFNGALDLWAHLMTHGPVDIDGKYPNLGALFSTFHEMPPPQSPTAYPPTPVLTPTYANSGPVGVAAFGGGFPAILDVSIKRKKTRKHKLKRKRTRRNKNLKK